MEMKNPGNRSSAAVRRTRAVPALLVVLMLPLVFHCGGSNEATEPPPSRPTVTPPATPAAAGLVRIAGGEGIRSDLVQVDFGIGGPTASDDIVSISFDVVLGDPTMLAPSEYAAGDIFPDDPDFPVDVIGSPAVLTDRIAVGIVKMTGPDGSGNGVGAGGARVLSVTFATLKKGSTTLWLENGVAYDSNGDEIGSITFDAATATVTQP